ncbi:MAG: D,D-dipeptide ABC transporter permease, partial [Defluviitaleaceae bacterium]|nr:D,D-dipeptide ABC transporter permease [Defluviitaleaceae bacterium]
MKIMEIRRALRSRAREWRLSFYLLWRNSLTRAALIVVVLLFLLAVFAPFIAPFPGHAGTVTNPAEMLLPPSSTYFFGTDEQGRDIFSRVLFGARISLQTAVIAVGLALAIGVPLGAAAGSVGGIT